MIQQDVIAEVVERQENHLLTLDTGLKRELAPSLKSLGSMGIIAYIIKF